MPSIPFWRILRSYGRSLLHAFFENEYTQQLKERYPRVARFLRNRFAPHEVLGLHLTVGFLLLFLVTVWFVRIMNAVNTSLRLEETDIRFLALVTTFRTKVLTAWMFFFSALGNWESLALIFLFVFFVLAWKKQWYSAWLLTLALGGGEGVTLLLKVLIGRVRPDIHVALLLETTPSFPSGHALASTAFFGFIAFLVFRQWRHVAMRFVVAFFFFVLIVCIGLSRIYLGVHWPSDVLGGFILGLLWLVILAVAWDWHHRFVKQHEEGKTPSLPRSIVFPFLLFLALVLSVYVMTFTFRKHPLSSPFTNQPVPSAFAIQQSSYPFDLMPTLSESLTGTPMEPVNVLFVGEESTIGNAFAAAGWFSAEPMTLRSFFRTGIRALRHAPYPTAPMSPAFLFGRPQDLSFQKPTTANSARERHHVRLWRMEGHMIDGRPLWVGTASFDAGIRVLSENNIPAHRIDPHIDAERAVISVALQETGFVQRVETVDRFEPFYGKNAFGDPFFTDGKVVVLHMN